MMHTFDMLFCDPEIRIAYSCPRSVQYSQRPWVFPQQSAQGWRRWDDGERDWETTGNIMLGIRFLSSPFGLLIKHIKPGLMECYELEAAFKIPTIPVEASVCGFEIMTVVDDFQGADLYSCCMVGFSMKQRRTTKTTVGGLLGIRD